MRPDKYPSQMLALIQKQFTPWHWGLFLQAPLKTWDLQDQAQGTVQKPVDMT